MNTLDRFTFTLKDPDGIGYWAESFRDSNPDMTDEQWEDVKLAYGVDGEYVTLTYWFSLDSITFGDAYKYANLAIETDLELIPLSIKDPDGITEAAHQARGQRGVYFEKALLEHFDYGDFYTIG